MADLETEFEAEVATIERQTDPMTEGLEPVTIRPRKRDIAVNTLGAGVAALPA